jgi:phosphoribosylformimino-5-aminoimidazole carboxamide ribotide isomerase
MIEVIPSIDLLAGKVVRLLKGDYEAVTVYGDDAAAVARQWQGHVSRLHVVDLEGARTGTVAQAEQIRRVVAAFGGGVQLGGGIRTLESVRTYLRLGLERVVIGTAALQSPELLEQASREFPGRIILAVDGRQGRVATHGWHAQSEQLAVDVVRARAHLPLAAVLYTDIDRDGTEVGPNVAETARLGQKGGIPVIASGGVGTLGHLTQLARASNEGNIAGVIIGRALHEKRFTLAEAVETVAASR